MVIHDLRNPTTQVEYLVKQLLSKMKDIKHEYKQLQQSANENRNKQRSDQN